VCPMTIKPASTNDSTKGNFFFIAYFPFHSKYP
ncbi:hypothetical protein ACUXG5_002029, partial [Staphylococcus hominis]